MCRGQAGDRREALNEEKTTKINPGGGPGLQQDSKYEIFTPCKSNSGTGFLVSEK